MDANKIIKKYPSVRNKTMAELIDDKHKKNIKELNAIRKKWLDNDTKTP